MRCNGWRSAPQGDASGQRGRRPTWSDRHGGATLRHNRPAQREVQAPLRGRHNHTAGRAVPAWVVGLLRRVPRPLTRPHPGHAVGRRGRDVERAGRHPRERRQVQRYERLLRAAWRREHRHVARAHGRRDVPLLVAVLAQVDRRRPYVDGPQAKWSTWRRGSAARPTTG